MLVRATVLLEEVFPTATVPKASVAGLMEIGRLPVPLRLTTCGESGAESLTESAPLIAPPTLGVKVTFTVQLAPEARLVPHVLLATAKFPVAPIEFIVTVDALEFFRVTVCAALVVAATCGLKER